MFDLETVLPRASFETITDLRVKHSASRTTGSPIDGGFVRTLARSRKKRKTLTGDGNLAIVAADHPARMVVDIQKGDGRMADRREYLARIVSVLRVSGWDGVMGTPDVLEDLLILDFVLREEGKEGFLDEKVLIGSMNRGGLRRSVFELDDRFTAYTAQSLYFMQFDGGKMLFQLDPEDRDSVRTMEACARAINELNYWGINVFLECLFVKDGKVSECPEDLIKAVSVAEALGDSSAYTWLKLPYVEEFGRVVASTTFPILMLGGVSKESGSLIKHFSSGMESGKNVRGVMVGRNILYPSSGDPPEEAALRICELVHR